MSSTFRVDTERIGAAAGDVRRISGSIESEVSAMMGRLNELKGSWEGTASANFAGVCEEWRRTQETVRTSLDNIAEALGLAGRQYAEAEQANSSMFRI